MTSDLGPRYGPMTSDEIRTARALHDTMRDGTYWQAAAVNASYMDADAVVRTWRALKTEDAARAHGLPVALWAALDVLDEGWSR